MAWDKDNPGDNVKIRNIAQEIRANWDAIENGDENVSGVAGLLEQLSVQFSNRSSVASSADPTTNAGTHYLYSKEDGIGTQELYTKDFDGNVIQLTNEGKIGGPSSQVNVQDVSFSAGTETYNENNAITAWAYVNGSGTLQDGVGLTSSRDSTGIYTLTFTTVAANATYGVLVIPLHTPPNPRIMSYSNLSTTDFKVRNVNADGIYGDTSFSVMVMGGR